MKAWISCLLFPFLAMVMAVSLAGCQSTAPEIVERTAELGYDTVVFTDYDLRRTEKRIILDDRQRFRFSVEGQGKRRNDMGNLEVWVALRNHTDSSYQLQVRTLFFDESGAPSEDASAWKPLPVGANSVANYRESSVRSRTAQYRVEVRQM